MRSEFCGKRPKRLDDLHEQAILLWIYAKKKNPDMNPAHGIYFALTDEVWPEGLPVAHNAIELCGVLNRATGEPPLTKEQEHQLNIKALVLFQQYESGRGLLNVVKYLVWADRFAYVLALASLLLQGFSWWVLSLMVAVWWCHGAARSAANMARHEERPEWEVAVIGSMHLLALVCLIGVSIARMLPT